MDRFIENAAAFNILTKTLCNFNRIVIFETIYCENLLLAAALFLLPKNSCSGEHHKVLDGQIY